MSRKTIGSELRLCLIRNWNDAAPSVANFAAPDNRYRSLAGVYQ